MAREIKFRCWDKKTKTIKNVMSISFKKEEVMIEPKPSDVNYEFFKTGDTFTGGYVRQMGDVVLMEFTGLYDKNGKEIYEGDIVFRGNNYIKPYGVISFENGVFDTFDLDSWSLCDRYEECEVIGNIHDNKELL